MALSYTQYIGDGTTRNFNITFPYIARNHVVVRIDGYVTPYTWLSANTVQLQTPPLAGAVIDIRRNTPRTELLVDFVDGSTLVETDLDLSALQVFYLAQEAFDLGEASLGVTEDGSFSALQRRISNVMDPVNAQDVATKNFVETGVTSQVAIAKGYRDEAIAARNASQTALSGAQTARTGAETARTGAETARTGAEAARTGAETARTGAEEARDIALSHRNAAAGSASSAAQSEATATQKASEAAASAVAAATFDPSFYYNKIESDDRYYTQAEVEALIAAGGVPIGTSIAWNSLILPPGFLKENGAAVSRATYNKLFTVIGTTFGVGDGSTTFNLPDSRGVVIRGLDDGRGLDAGRTLGSYQADQNLAHTHSVYDPGHSHQMDVRGGVENGSHYAPVHSRWTVPSPIPTYAAVTNISLYSSGGSEARMKNTSKLIIIRAF